MLERIKKFIFRMYLRYNAWNNFRNDFWNHLKFSVHYHKECDYTQGMLRCSIMLLNHQLEKAQTYKEQRDGYGQEKIKKLLNLVNVYVKKYGYDSLVYTSIGVIKAHLSNPHSYKDVTIRNGLDNLIFQIKDKSQLALNRGGIISLSANNISTNSHFLDLIHSRHSCRQYAERSIEKDIIQKVVYSAMTSPSACNRQCVRAHYYDNPELITNIILAQKSDVQWCLKAKGLFIITADREYFRDYYERNQRMFDAGLFSMTLCLSLHNEGIGSCFKMAQKEISIDIKTKSIAGIPKSEDICVLLLIGYYPSDKIIYAKSSRLDIEEILTIHK